MKYSNLTYLVISAIVVLSVACDRSSDDSVEDVHPTQVEELSDPLAVGVGEGEGEGEGEGDESVAATLDDKIEEKIPATLDEALEMMVEALSEKDREFIEDAGGEFADFSHFGSEMGMQNSWVLWGDSPLNHYFIRLGIYHVDDMSAIINDAFSRRVRGKDIELDKLVQYYREYWEEQDIIAPLNLNCPHCSEEMAIGYMGDGVARAHPDRVYFSGICPDGEEFVFYHKDGWRSLEALENEQIGADQPAVAPNSKVQ